MSGKEGLAATRAKEATTAAVDKGPDTGGTERRLPDKVKAAEAAAAAVGAGSSNSGDRVEAMMARLRLTATEATVVVVNDADDLGLIDPDRAFVGKVLSPNVLHINTIRSALRAASGNPRGLILNSAGDNMFTAEFGLKADRERVMDGSPWIVGRHAVWVKKYDVDVVPHQIAFDRLAIWARILSLPPRLMNLERGQEIAKPIGIVKRIEADELDR
ncbi:unnamed protein product [Alopecurus aequalis]